MTTPNMKKIEKLRLPELQATFRQIVGEETRSPNRTFLLRRIKEVLTAPRPQPGAARSRETTNERLAAVSEAFAANANRDATEDDEAVSAAEGDVALAATSSDAGPPTPDGAPESDATEAPPSAATATEGHAPLAPASADAGCASADEGAGPSADVDTASAPMRDGAPEVDTAPTDVTAPADETDAEGDGAERCDPAPAFAGAGDDTGNDANEETPTESGPSADAAEAVEASEAVAVVEGTPAAAMEAQAPPVAGAHAPVEGAPSLRRPRTARTAPTENDTPRAPRGPRGRFKSMTVEELQTLYRSVVGRETGSSDAGYLAWKIKEAEKGRVPVGPRETRTPAQEANTDMHTLPLRLDSARVIAIDEVWRARGMKSRMELFRTALGHYLHHVGANAAAALFDAPEDRG